MFWGLNLSTAQFLPGLAAPQLRTLLVVMGLMDAAASGLATWLPRRLGLLRAMSVLFVLQALLLAALLLPGTVLRVVALLLARLPASALYNLQYILLAEAFPPHLRSTGAGVVTAIGRLGTLCAPVLVLLPAAVVVVLCSAASLLAGCSFGGLARNPVLHPPSGGNPPDGDAERGKEGTACAATCLEVGVQSAAVGGAAPAAPAALRPGGASELVAVEV